MAAASTGAITMLAAPVAIFHNVAARCSCTSACGEICSNGSTSCAGSRSPRSAGTAPVSSHAERSERYSESAALLSATSTTAGSCAARASKGRYRARAVAVRPETRRRPRPRERWRVACSKDGDRSSSPSSSRTKGRITPSSLTARPGAGASMCPRQARASAARPRGGLRTRSLSGMDWCDRTRAGFGSEAAFRECLYPGAVLAEVHGRSGCRYKLTPLPL